MIKQQQQRLRRTKQINEKRDHRSKHHYSRSSCPLSTCLRSCCPRSSCPRCSASLGGNFPTSVAARKSITPCWHISMENSSDICTCRHLPAFQPGAFPTVFQSVVCWFSIGCSGGRDTPASLLLALCTTSICRPLDAQTASGTLQSGHARSSVYRTSQPVASRLSLVRISSYWRCPSAYSCSPGSTSQPPTFPLPELFRPRLVWRYSRPKCIYVHVLCTIDLLVPFLPGGHPLRFQGFVRASRPSGSRGRCPARGGP